MSNPAPSERRSLTAIRAAAAVLALFRLGMATPVGAAEPADLCASLAGLGEPLRTTTERGEEVCVVLIRPRSAWVIRAADPQAAAAGLQAELAARHCEGESVPVPLGDEGWECGAASERSGFIGFGRDFMAVARTGRIRLAAYAPAGDEAWARDTLRKLFSSLGAGSAAANRPPRLVSAHVRPEAPTVDDDVELHFAVEDPDGDSVTVRWWGPHDAGERVVTAGAGEVVEHRRAGVLEPGEKSYRVTLDGGAAYEDGLRFKVEAPAARLESSSGRVRVGRRPSLRRLESRTVPNLYAGDVVGLCGAGNDMSGPSEATLVWPGEGGPRARCAARMNPRGSTVCASIVIAPTPEASGLQPTGPAEMVDALVEQGLGEGLELVIERLGGAFLAGVADFASGADSAGSPGLVFVRLRSSARITGSPDGAVRVLALEGSPEVYTARGARPLALAPGEEVVASPGRSLPSPSRVDLASLDAWWRRGAPPGKNVPAARATPIPPVDTGAGSIPGSASPTGFSELVDATRRDFPTRKLPQGDGWTRLDGDVFTMSSSADLVTYHLITARAEREFFATADVHLREPRGVPGMAGLYVSRFQSAENRAGDLFFGVSSQGTVLQRHDGSAWRNLSGHGAPVPPTRRAEIVRRAGQYEVRWNGGLLSRTPVGDEEPVHVLLYVSAGVEGAFGRISVSARP